MNRLAKLNLRPAEIQACHRHTTSKSPKNEPSAAGFIRSIVRWYVQWAKSAGVTNHVILELDTNLRKAAYVREFDALQARIKAAEDKLNR